MKKNKIIIAFLCIIITLNATCIRGNAMEVTERNVYLTFDDGPSPTNTRNILKVLEKNNVRGTFFVVGANIIQYQSVLRECDSKGMAIYPHCNNHIYDELYQSKEEYFNDLAQCISTIEKTLNKNLDFKYVRMPGGSDNLVSNSRTLESIRNEIIASGKSYIDWNIDSGDACAVRVSSDIIKNNIKNSLGSYPIEVVLMHDTENKDTTCEALQGIINDYKALGYNFKTLNEINEIENNYLKRIRVVNR